MARMDNSIDAFEADTIDRFCERWDIGRTMVYEEIAAGRLKAVVIGGRRRITRQDGREWFAQYGVPVAMKSAVA